MVKVEQQIKIRVSEWLVFRNSRMTKENLLKRRCNWQKGKKKNCKYSDQTVDHLLFLHMSLGQICPECSKLWLLGSEPTLSVPAFGVWPIIYSRFHWTKTSTHSSYTHVHLLFLLCFLLEAESAPREGMDHQSSWRRAGRGGSPASSNRPRMPCRTGRTPGSFVVTELNGNGVDCQTCVFLHVHTWPFSLCLALSTCTSVQAKMCWICTEYISFFPSLYT